jgi:hypothetical protein
LIPFLGHFVHKFSYRLLLKGHDVFEVFWTISVTHGGICLFLRLYLLVVNSSEHQLSLNLRPLPWKFHTSDLLEGMVHLASKSALFTHHPEPMIMVSITSAEHELASFPVTHHYCLWVIRRIPAMSKPKAMLCIGPCLPFIIWSFGFFVRASNSLNAFH